MALLITLPERDPPGQTSEGDGASKPVRIRTDASIGQVLRYGSEQETSPGPFNNSPTNSKASSSAGVCLSPTRRTSKSKDSASSPSVSPSSKSPTRRKKDSQDDEMSLVSGPSGLTVQSLRGDDDIIFTAEGYPFPTLYTMDKVLGSGAFGEVSLVTCKRTKEQRAVKRQSIDHLVVFQNEFSVAKKMKHPNIIMIHDMLTDDENCYLVMDICTGGDLTAYYDSRFETAGFQNCYDPPPVKILAVFLWQMLQSLRYLHHHKIIHRDIKLGNILLDKPVGESDDVSTINLKLIDFGAAKKFTKGELLKESLCTLGYSAPEVLGHTGYDAMSDVWSIGICAFILFDGDMPIEFPESGSPDSEMHKAIMKAEISYQKILDNYPRDAVELLQVILDKDPTTRSTAKQALATNAWLRREGRGRSAGCCCTMS